MTGKIRFVSAMLIMAILMTWVPWGYAADRTVQLSVPACDS